MYYKEKKIDENEMNFKENNNFKETEEISIYLDGGNICKYNFLNEPNVLIYGS